MAMIIVGYEWTMISRDPIILSCQARYDHGAVSMTGLREVHLSEIEQWCITNDCGRRTLFNDFEMANEEQLTHFLLRWS